MEIKSALGADKRGKAFVAATVWPRFDLLPPTACANPRRVAAWIFGAASSTYVSRSCGAIRCYNQVDRPPTESRSMSGLLSSYLPIVIFIGVAMVVGLALIAAPFLVAYRNPDPEKLSAYECGFNSFDDARMKFDIRFYLVSILFIIFDLEVAFLFPWAVSFSKIGMLGFWSMMVFLAVLTIGFIYEWKKGALEWD
jgi:NADH-quinone oxidoreductase subunit A